MPNDYYPGADADMEPTEGADAGEMKDGADEGEAKEEQGAGESALIPKSLLAGKEFKPGDELVLKIRALHGDEVEVEYATEEKTEKTMDDGKPMSKARAGISDRLSAMADMG